MAQKNLIGENSGERKINPSANPEPVLSGHSKRTPNIGFQDRLSLNAGQKYCRMLQRSILQYFQPKLSYHIPLRSWFCLFLSARLRQVLLYPCLSIVMSVFNCRLSGVRMMYNIYLYSLTAGHLVSSVGIDLVTPITFMPKQLHLSATEKQYSIRVQSNNLV